MSIDGEKSGGQPTSSSEGGGGGVNNEKEQTGVVVVRESRVREKHEKLLRESLKAKVQNRRNSSGSDCAQQPQEAQEGNGGDGDQESKNNDNTQSQVGKESDSKDKAKDSKEGGTCVGETNPGTESKSSPPQQGRPAAADGGQQQRKSENRATNGRRQGSGSRDRGGRRYEHRPSHNGNNRNGSHYHRHRHHPRSPRHHQAGGPGFPPHPPPHMMRRDWRGGGPPPPPPPHGRGGRGGDYYDDGGRGGGGMMDRFGRMPRRGGGDYGRRGRDHRGSDRRRRRTRSLSRSRSRSRSSSRSSYSSGGSGSYSSRSRSRSRSRSSASSRSHGSRSTTTSRSIDSRENRSSRSRGRSSRSGESRSGSSTNRRAKRRRSRSPSHSSCSSRSSYDSSSSKSSADDDDDNKDKETAANGYTKDQRTVFVSQLVMRTVERDLRQYFRKMAGKVNDVILLRDKRTGHHKGCAYVELRRMEDVGKALALSGQAPDFQRFPVLVKASEAEKNYVVSSGQVSMTAGQSSAKAITAPTAAGGRQKPPPKVIGPNGKVQESQKVYVGGLDPSVSQEHLFALFNQFGPLQKVIMQKDPSTGISKGFAFLSFIDPKEANLAIQSMAGQVLAGRPIKTGWANQVSNSTAMEYVTSDEFPADAAQLAQKAYQVLAQFAMGVTPAAAVAAAAEPSATAAAAAASTTTNAATAGAAALAAAGSGGGGGPVRVPTVAEARASLAAQAAKGADAGGLLSSQAVPVVANTAAVNATATDAKIIGNADCPTKNVLVHNMYNKDEETDPGWEVDIKEEFQEECSKYGEITSITVMHKDPGGKIYASFTTIDGAKTCASTLAGRWFDKRQLRVEFVPDDELPAGS